MLILAYTGVVRLQASGFRDGLILHMCEREGPDHWQYHKVVGELVNL